MKAQSGRGIRLTRRSALPSALPLSGFELRCRSLCLRAARRSRPGHSGGRRHHRRNRLSLQTNSTSPAPKCFYGLGKHLEPSAVSGLFRPFSRSSAPNCEIVMAPGRRGGRVSGVTTMERWRRPQSHHRSPSTLRLPELQRDWVMTHEMVHYGFPFYGRGASPGSKRAARPTCGADRPGRRWEIFRLTQVWGDMIRDMPQGLPGPGRSKGLDRTHTWGRKYWGGAIYSACNRRYKNSGENRESPKGLVNALRALNRGLEATSSSDWTQWKKRSRWRIGPRGRGKC